MRSIPFKVVAVLGLNDQDYPRSVTPSSLDLMHTRRRLGDRSRRDEDRYLFLEAILSARESLWLSYRSKSQQNDEPLTPSVVLAELLDYIQANFLSTKGSSDSDAGQSLLTQHPLQAFNPIYFQADSTLFSYNKDWLAVHTPLEDAPKEVAASDFQELEDTVSNEILMEDFIQFFMHPAKYYLNKVLKVNLFFESDVQDDDEPFELDYLQQYQVKQNVIKQFLNEKGGKDVSHSVSEGLNAFGEIGERQWRKLKSTIEPVLECCEEYMQNKIQDPVEINLTFDDLSVSLMGWQKDLYGANLVKVVPSKLKAKSIIPAILEHAALCAMGKGHTCVVICQDQKFNLQIMEQKQAKQYLHVLVQEFQQGQHTPLAMLPQSAWQLHNPVHLKEKKGELVDKRLAEAQKTFYGASGPFGQPGEREDINIRRCFDELDEIPEPTHKLAKSFYAPWLESNLLFVLPLNEDAS